MHLYWCHGTSYPCRVNITALVNASCVPTCPAQFKCCTYINSFKLALSEYSAAVGFVPVRSVHESKF